MYKIDLSSPMTRVSLAIAASVLLHTLFANSRLLMMPKPDFDSSSFFTAELAPLPQQQMVAPELKPETTERNTPSPAAAPIATKPAPTPAKPQMHAPAPEPDQAPTQSSQGKDSETVSPAPVVQTAAVDEGAAPRPLPGFVELDFAFLDGQQQLRGRALHTVKIFQQHYVLTAVFEGDYEGLVRQEETSRGTFNRYGFRSGTYANVRQTTNDRQRSDVELNWNNLSLTQAGQTSEFPLETQDGLSWIYQLSQLPLYSGTHSIAVTDGQQLKAYQLMVRGVVNFDSPQGPLRALHVDRVGDDQQTTQVWLSISHQMLPIKVRQLAADGSLIYELQLRGARSGAN